jgi:hypothetical protein
MEGVYVIKIYYNMILTKELLHYVFYQKYNCNSMDKQGKISQPNR